MTEGKKIGLACAIGGAIGTAVALIVAAPFWWLGLLAGFSGGYVSYEFRAVLRAIPQAWKMTVIAMRGVSSLLIDVAAGLGGQMRTFSRWFFAPHPILHTALFFGVTIGPSSVWVTRPFSWTVPIFTVLSLLVTALITMVVFWVVNLFSAVGALKLKPDLPCYHCDNCLLSWTYESVKEITIYRDLWWLTLRGIVYAVFVVVALLPFRFVVGLIDTTRASVRFTGIFFVILIRLIHSDKRLLCGVDAAIGTGVAYVTLARPEMTVVQHALVIAAGAMIGAALGVLNYEVVSKRILRLNGGEVAQ